MIKIPENLSLAGRILSYGQAGQVSIDDQYGLEMQSGLHALDCPSILLLSISKYEIRSGLHALDCPTILLLFISKYEVRSGLHELDCPSILLFSLGKYEVRCGLHALDCPSILLFSIRKYKDFPNFSIKPYTMVAC